MNGTGHRLSTQKAFDILKSINSGQLLLDFTDIVANEAVETDNYHDLEFVDVEGGVGSGGRDNPHESEWLAVDDEPHKSRNGNSFTAFNHFIDIKKGAGLFDDYDGYSYAKGSGHVGQHQSASNAASDFWEEMAGDITGMKVDEGVNWWFNDEYVHAACHSWYRNCSPAVTNYSFPQDKGIYATVNNELSNRFPYAESAGANGKGIPYSVFMPVDNLARYWYNQFLSNRVPKNLGPVMHAIQDASIIHHAAGYLGNWHGKYESVLADNIPAWLNDNVFIKEIKDLIAQWAVVDPNPPAQLNQNDWQKTPAQNWRIDKLVTWVALNAYKEYAQTYNHFNNGYMFDINSAKKLTKLAIAVCTLVLKNAEEYCNKEIQLMFDYNTAAVVNTGHWIIADGAKRILDFGVNQASAQKALQIIKHYHMNSMVVIGNINNPAMQYFLVNGNCPVGAFPGEDAIPFDPTKVEVKQINGTWKIVEGGHYLLDFGNNQFNANIGLNFIKRHGFKYICFVGRPKASMTYFRK